MRCPKCAGCLAGRRGGPGRGDIQNYDDLYCINCSWRPITPVAEPILPNPKRQWTPGICEICLNSAVRGKRYCRRCGQRESMIHHHGPGLASGSGG
jgi:hypothetical protein